MDIYGSTFCQKIYNILMYLEREDYEFDFFFRNQNRVQATK